MKLAPLLGEAQGDGESAMVLASISSSAAETARGAVPTASSLLAELGQTHDRLRAAVAELEHLTRRSVPDDEKFTDTRWELSRASLARRMLWARILGFLLPRVSGDDAAALHRLQERDIELLRTSTRHVARWTADNALADWPTYCDASRVMRAKMLAAMEEERGVVAPLLKSQAAGLA